MAETSTHQLNRWSQVGYALIWLSVVLLPIMIWQSRITRLQRLPDDVAFFSTNFIVVSGIIVTLIALTVIAVLFGKLSERLTPTITWGWIIVSLIGLVVMLALVAAFAFYALSFILWLVLVDAGVLLIVYQQQLTKMDMMQLARNGFAMLMGIAITFLMLEIALRVYFGVLGSPSQKVAYLYSVPQILEAANRYQGQPYTNYGLSPNHREHNQYGYRGANFALPKPENTYRIFTLGGSTTYGEGISPSEAYPAILQEILHDEYGYTHVEVVNAGVNAYSSFDSLANLTYHILDHEPDMILVYHGVNDVRARLVDPQFYTGANPQRGTWNPSALSDQLSPSVVVRFTMINTGLIESPTQFETILGADGTNIPRCGFFETICSQVRDTPAEDVIASNPPRYLERNLINMRAIASANEIDTVISTWLHFADDTDLPNPMALQHMQRAVDEQNEIIRNLGDTLDVPVADFAETDALDDASFWQDGMHMTPPGTRFQAEFYAAYLIENDLLPAPSDNNER